MSPNLGFGLFERSISHFSPARQTSVPISPQDFDRTVVSSNLANYHLHVKSDYACRLRPGRCLGPQTLFVSHRL